MALAVGLFGCGLYNSIINEPVTAHENDTDPNDQNEPSDDNGNSSECDDCDRVCVEGECVGFRQLSAGAHHTCAITDDDRLYCWGANDSGQLGLDESVDQIDEPTRIGN